MLRHTFVPDYTVRAVTEVFYVRVKRSLYLAAKRATLLERSQKDPSPSNDQFDDEVEKVNKRINCLHFFENNFNFNNCLLSVMQLLHSLDEDDRSAPSSPTLTRKDDDTRSNDNQSSPMRSATAPTSPIPVSASPLTNSKFVSPKNGPNGQLKTSPIKIIDIPSPQEGGRLDLDAEIAARQSEAARLLSGKKTNVDDEEKVNLLMKEDRS